MWIKPVIKAMKRNSRVPWDNIVRDKGGISWAEGIFWTMALELRVWGKDSRADGKAVNEDNDW